MLNRVISALNINHQKCFHISLKMPKNKKSTSEAKGKSSSEKNCPPKNDVKGAVYVGNNNEIVVKIHAKPGAKESAITDLGNETVGVQIGAPPVDGEANKELIRFLAEILKLRKSDISLDKGSRSKEKTVIISKGISVSSVKEALQDASKQ